MSQEEKNKTTDGTSTQGNGRAPNVSGTAKNGGNQPVKRRRRRKKRGLGAFGALVYVILVVGISILLASYGWLWACDLLALNKEYTAAIIELPQSVFQTETVEVEIYDDDDNVIGYKDENLLVADLDYVTDLLKANGLIEYDYLFKIFVVVTGAETDLTVGSYELNTEMDYRALITSMGSSSSSRTSTNITFSEGMTLAQIFAKLDEAGVCTEEDLYETSANYDFKFSFLKDVLPLGDDNRLEGYLFPDTYEFYIGDDAVTVINKMLIRFDELYTDEMRALTEEMGYTMHEILTIASMIEKETDSTDQSSISSVIYNRLERPNSETVGYLNIDATIAYVTGTVVTVDDYQMVDSPYNTYTNTGLPPGPIANPGMVAIRAALYPADEDYYYYALGTDGYHHYFYTLAQLTEFVANG